jgi:transposase
MEGRPASYFRREIVNAIPDLVRKDCTGRSLPHDLPADRIVFH